MPHFTQIFLMLLVALAPFNATAEVPIAPRETLDADLIARLQPLRARRESLAAPLVAIAKLVERKRYPQACAQIAKLRVNLVRKAAPLFYQPTRQGGGDVEGVSHFLQTHVEGPKPTLQIIQETFVPSQAMRALAVEACVRANQPQQALPFVADLALLSHDPQSRLTLGLLKAQIAGRWQEAMASIDLTVTGPRAALLRALAGQPPGAQALCAQAWREAASPEEVALARQVARQINVALPTTAPGATP